MKVSDLLVVRDVRSPLVLSREAVRLSPVRGRVAGGEVEGEVTVRLAGGFRWNARLSVKRARVETLLAEAGALRKGRGFGRGPFAFSTGPLPSGSDQTPPRA